jgi:diacylglycerol O-acyltransferase
MTTTDSAYMRASDAFTWYMERDPALRSTVVVIDWLDRAPDWEVLVDRVDRISRLMPSLRQRIVESPFRLTVPRWANDPHFDLHWHLSRITAPAPGTRDAVLEVGRRAAMAAFDRDRPLWEVTLVEGMEGGEAALVIKLHHSLSDGVGAMRMLAIVADLQREPADLGELPPVPPHEPAGLLTSITGTSGEIAGFAAGLAWRGTGAAIPAWIRYARDPIGYVRGAVGMARSVYRTAAPNRSTLSPLMRERAMTRRLATIEVSLDALKKSAKSVGGTVNDAYLAAIAGGLRRYHERHGTAVDSLRALMPINLRAGQDTNWGNRITLQRLIVPVGDTDPAARMRALHRVAMAAREEPSLSVTEAIAGALNMLPVGYVGGILKHVDFVASNVPGVPVPVFFAGSKVTGMFAFGPTIGASVNITLMSYDGTCDIGINIDTAAVPDPDVLLGCLRESLAEITALGEGEPATGAMGARPGPGCGRRNRTA